MKFEANEFIRLTKWPPCGGHIWKLLTRFVPIEAIPGQLPNGRYRGTPAQQPARAIDRYGHTAGAQQ